MMKNYKMGRRQRNWAKILLIMLILAVIGSGMAVFVVRQAYYKNLDPVSASEHSILVTISTGETAQEIGQKLLAKGLIRSTWAFEWYVRTHNARESLQAGTYSIRPNQTVAEIISILTQGKVTSSLITILPAQRLSQIKDALINNGFTPDEVEKAFNPALYVNHPALRDKPQNASLEGYLYPETFQKTAQTTVESIINASLDELQKVLTPQVRADIAKQGLTLHQGIILASIIEREVSRPADKPVVAQVFLKRFRSGMPLGSDVTAFYGAIIDGVELSDNPGQAATIAVGHNSPYNTRMHVGFPPGPISNVGKLSIEAVTSPSTTDYLYFVAGDDGITYFSKTLQEHEQLTVQHCKKLCQ